MHFQKLQKFHISFKKAWNRIFCVKNTLCELRDSITNHILTIAMIDSLFTVNISDYTIQFLGCKEYSPDNFQFWQNFFQFLREFNVIRIFYVYRVCVGAETKQVYAVQANGALCPIGIQTMKLLPHRVRKTFQSLLKK